MSGCPVLHAEPGKPTGEQRSTLVEDIPPVRVEVVEHVAHLGCCRRCGQEVSEPLPGDTPKGKPSFLLTTSAIVASSKISATLIHR